MAGISRVGVDHAGGLIVGQRQAQMDIDGTPVAVVGDPVAGHPPCPDVSSHCAPTMASGSGQWDIDGRPICRAGDTATCGHAATGLAAWDIG